MLAWPAAVFSFPPRLPCRFVLPRLETLPRKTPPLTMPTAANLADVERCTMGVPGLDAVLDGGLPAERLYLVQGDPGVGKTTLAMQFLMEGARLGQRGL